MKEREKLREMKKEARRQFVPAAHRLHHRRRLSLTFLGRCSSSSATATAACRFGKDFAFFCLI